MWASEAHIEPVSAITHELKSQRLVARVTKTHKRLFEHAAALEGRSVATFVIAHALKAAGQIVGEQDIIRLNREQSRRFAEALLAPPGPMQPAFRKAHREYAKRVVNRL